MNTTEETTELQLAPAQPDEAPMKQLAPYDEFKTKIESLKKTAETITVTDISQTAEMKIARATRLSLKDIRVAITHRHRELKENILVEGRKIDAGKNELLAVLEPLELRLKDQEEFIEREVARIAQEKRSARTAELTPFLSAPVAIDLGTMTDDAYSAMLADAKDAQAARLARDTKEKEEAAAKAKAEAEERARVVAENERLKVEAQEREAAARKEREEAAAALAKAQREAEAKAKEVQAKADAEAKKLREEAAERERVAAEKAKAEAEKARKEREAIEAEAAKENARLAAIAEAQRQEAAKATAELAAKKAAEEKAAADKLAAEKKAAAAPDKAKLAQLVVDIQAIRIPRIQNEVTFDLICSQRDKFTAWIEKQAESL